MRVVFVHGACVRDGQWWWHRTAEVLAARGVTSAAALLPSCGEGEAVPGPDGPGLPEDAAVLRTLLDGEPCIVVGHSYGGIVTAQAAAGVDTVAHVLLISSYLAEPGESLSTFGSEEPAPFLDVDLEAATFGVRLDALTATFLQDCPPEVVDEAPRHAARQSLAVTQQPVTASPWARVPSTYLVCADDRGTPAAAQREFARRAGRTVEIAAGHHPFLSQPAAVADLILDLAL